MQLACSIGAIWVSVSCPRTFSHVGMRRKDLNHWHVGNLMAIRCPYYCPLIHEYYMGLNHNLRHVFCLSAGLPLWINEHSWINFKEICPASLEVIFEMLDSALRQCFLLTRSCTLDSWIKTRLSTNNLWNNSMLLTMWMKRPRDPFSLFTRTPVGKVNPLRLQIGWIMWKN